MAAKWKFLATFLIIAVFIYATKAILLPFVAGFAVAYFLDPVADKLVSWRFPRSLASITIIILFFLGLAGFVVALLPVIQAQIGEIAVSLPGYIAKIRPLLENLLQSAATTFQIDAASDADSFIAAAAEKGLARLSEHVGDAISGGLAIFNLLTLLVISPVVAFFLLRDWDLIVNKIDSWLPRAYKGRIKEQTKLVDAALAGFVRGQTIVCIIMGTIYAIGWSIVGLDYAVILGLLAGILGFIPLAGTLFAALIALLVGFGQWGADAAHLGGVFIVFLLVQVLEGAVLTPRLIGERVGLHPVWVIFAIFAGGEIMGFVGILIAVPAAAVIAVLVRFTIDQYLQSDLHGGPPYHIDDPVPDDSTEPTQVAAKTDVPADQAQTP